MSSTSDDLDWNYSISDSREDFCNSKLFPNAKNHYNATVDAFFDLVSASELKNTDILLLGHDWSEDEHRLLELLNICQSNTFLPNGKQFPRIGVIEVEVNGKRSVRKHSITELVSNCLMTLSAPLA